MITMNDIHPSPKSTPTYRIRKEAMDAAVFVIGPHARHGFEYETSKVDGRWIWRHTDEVRPDTPAEVKTNGGKKSLMLASTPMAHIGAAKPVKLPVPPRRTPPQAQGKPAGAPDGGAGGEQPPSDEMPPCNALTPPIDTIEIVDVVVAGPACNGLDIAKPDGLDLPTFLKRNPAPAKSSTYDEMKSAGALRSEPVAKPVGKPPVSRKAAKGKIAPKAAKRASKAPAKTAEHPTKNQLLAEILRRPEGCTAEEARKYLGWSSVSISKQAPIAGITKLKKSKDNGVTRYWAR